LRVDTLFGGKILILSGDFRQTCPIIRKGTKAQVINASIRSLPFWNDLKIYHLTVPHHNAQDPQVLQWVDAIGDGAGPEISLLMLRLVNDMRDVLEFVFPPHILQDPLQCLRQSILAPTHRQVDLYNSTLLKQIHGEQCTYMAANCLKEVTTASLTSPDSVLDYAAKQTPPGLPPHTLHIKVNGIY